MAFAKSQMAAGFSLPLKGNVFISVHDHHKESAIPIARSLEHMGFRILATGGTADYLKANGIESQTISKVSEGRPNVVDFIKNGDIHLVINTGIGRRSSLDAYHIRRGALTYNIPYTTTIAGARAVSEAIGALQKEEWQVRPLQEYYAGETAKGERQKAKGTEKKKPQGIGKKSKA
jgi:carbamoyl-phosphate synthase large subunit